MSKFGNINASSIINFPEEKGFKKSRQKGSHIFFRYDDDRTVPVHNGEDLSKGLLAKILRDIEFEKDEFLNWLGK